MKPFQCRMARAALDWSTTALAAKAGVGVNTINRFEKGQDARISSVGKMQSALETAGVIFVQENGDGPGVRLRKTGEAGHAHALEKAEETVDRKLAEVDAHPEEKATRKRAVTRVARELATGLKTK